MNKNAFRKDWGLARGKEQPKVKEEIMRQLCITTRNGFYNRRKDEVSHNDTEKETIENIFFNIASQVCAILGVHRNGLYKRQI